MLDALSGLNWIAVIVAAVAYYIIGAIWYAPPVLGKRWIRSMGISDQSTPNIVSLLAPVIFYFLTAIVLGALVSLTHTTTVVDAIVLGAIIWGGFALPLTAVIAIYDPQKPAPGSWALITSAYHLVSLCSAAVLLSLWPY